VTLRSGDVRWVAIGHGWEHINAVLGRGIHMAQRTDDRGVAATISPRYLGDSLERGQVIGDEFILRRKSC